MTLDQAIKAFEAKRTVIPGPPCAYFEFDAEHRGVYATVCSGGVKDEGQVVPALYATEASAIDAWLDAVERYAAGKGRYVYWRMNPRLVSETRGEDCRYYVHCRVLVTDLEWPKVGPILIPEPHSRNLVVTDGLNGFAISREDIEDALAPSIFAAGLRILQLRQTRNEA